MGPFFFEISHLLFALPRELRGCGANDRGVEAAIQKGSFKILESEIGG